MNWLGAFGFPLLQHYGKVKRPGYWDTRKFYCRKSQRSAVFFSFV